MKLCEVCHTAEVMPVPIKDVPSVGVKMEGSPSGTLTYFYPTEPGTLCYYCGKKEAEKAEEKEATWESKIRVGREVKWEKALNF
jgi:hypothetical protein